MQSSGHVLFKEIKALKPEKSLEMAQVLFLETRLLFSILNIVQVLSAFWNEITGLSFFQGSPQIFKNFSDTDFFFV